MGDHSEVVGNDSESFEKKSWEDLNDLQREYLMLHSMHTANEMDEKKRIEDKNSKFFLGAAIFFYFLSLVMPSMFMLMYMIAGTTCLFLQYLVSIGKVGFGYRGLDN